MKDWLQATDPDFVVGDCSNVDEPLAVDVIAVGDSSQSVPSDSAATPVAIADARITARRRAIDRLFRRLQRSVNEVGAGSFADPVSFVLAPYRLHVAITALHFQSSLKALVPQPARARHERPPMQGAE